jgi:hypothetical protein
VPEMGARVVRWGFARRMMGNGKVGRARMLRWGFALRLMGMRIADKGTRRGGRKSCDVRYGKQTVGSLASSATGGRAGGRLGERAFERCDAVGREALGSE